MRFDVDPARVGGSLSPSADKNFTCFKYIGESDKISRRGANRGNKRLFSLTYH